MKHFLLALLLCFSFGTFANSATPPGDEDIILYWKLPTSPPPVPRMPMETPTLIKNGYTIYINGDHPDYVVRLVDVDDENNVAYQTVMPSDVSSIVLPSTLSGTYQIQLLWGDWMFYGWINL